jgi:hypothetical protein
MRVKNATYDAATYSVVFDFTTPLEPGQAYRVEVNQEAVCGLRGESLSPAAQARNILFKRKKTYVCGLRGESLSPAAQARNILFKRKKKYIYIYMSAGYGGCRFRLPPRRVIYYFLKKKHMSAGYGGSRFRLPPRRDIFKRKKKYIYIYIYMSAGYGGSRFRLPPRRAITSLVLSLYLSLALMTKRGGGAGRSAD